MAGGKNDILIRYANDGEAQWKSMIYKSVYISLIELLIKNIISPTSHIIPLLNISQLNIPPPLNTLY